MRKHLILGLGLVLALAVATPAQADDDLRSTIRDEISKWSQANDDNTFKVHWKNGLRLDSKNVQMAIGGRVEVRQYPGDDEMDTIVLRDVDDWIMRRIVAESTIADSDRWSTSPTLYSSN